MSVNNTVQRYDNAKVQWASLAQLCAIVFNCAQFFSIVSDCAQLCTKKTPPIVGSVVCGTVVLSFVSDEQQFVFGVERKF